MEARPAAAERGADEVLPREQDQPGRVVPADRRSRSRSSSRSSTSCATSRTRSSRSTRSRPRVARARRHHGATTIDGWGPLLLVVYVDQPADVVVLHVDDDAEGAADPAARPADRLHPVHPQLPVRPDDLLADDEPVDDGPGPRHAASSMPKPEPPPRSGARARRRRTRRPRSRPTTATAPAHAGRPTAATADGARPPSQASSAKKGGAADGGAPMTDELSVEATGETVGEAKWAALRELERLAPGPRPRRGALPGRDARASAACSASATRRPGWSRARRERAARRREPVRATRAARPPSPARARRAGRSTTIGVDGTIEIDESERRDRASR